MVVLAALGVLGFPSAETDTFSRDFDFIMKYAPPQDAPLPPEYVTKVAFLPRK